LLDRFQRSPSTHTVTHKLLMVRVAAHARCHPQGSALDC